MSLHTSGPDDNQWEGWDDIFAGEDFENDSDGESEEGRTIPEELMVLCDKFEKMIALLAIFDAYASSLGLILINFTRDAKWSRFEKFCQSHGLNLELQNITETLHSFGILSLSFDSLRTSFDEHFWKQQQVNQQQESSTEMNDSSSLISSLNSNGSRNTLSLSQIKIGIEANIEEIWLNLLELKEKLQQVNPVLAQVNIHKDRDTLGMNESLETLVFELKNAHRFLGKVFDSNIWHSLLEKHQIITEAFKDWKKNQKTMETVVITKETSTQVNQMIDQD